MLNWMRETIRVRKAQPALGRGEVRFLEVANRAVLAYLRSTDEETILVVNNLSEEEQAVELDLAEFIGAEFIGSEPVDLLSRERLPAVSESAYRMDLTRYGYRWLRLR